MFNLWKPFIPVGVEGSWAPVLEKDTAGTLVKEAWYFNGAFPWVGMAICAPVIGLWYWCTDQYIVQRASARLTRKSRGRAASSPLFSSSSRCTCLSFPA